MAASNHQQQNGQIIGLGGIGALENDADTKLFVVKKTGDSQGITALISRQLQGMYSFLCIDFYSIIKEFNQKCMINCLSLWYYFELCLYQYFLIYCGTIFLFKKKLYLYSVYSLLIKISNLSFSYS